MVVLDGTETGGGIIAESIRKKCNLPVVEIEVPPVCDAMKPSLRTRFAALIEVIMERRKK